MAISYLFVFIFGLVVGSFLNCVIYRLEVGKSFLKGRSFCPDCKHDLSWLDLIPVFSYIFLSGKCRYCDKKISIQYPLVEISTGLMFLLIFQNSLLTANFYFLFSVLYFLTAASLLIIIFVFDLKHFIIPDRVLFPLIGIALIYGLIFNLQSLNGLINIFVSAFSAGAFFLAIYLVSRGKWLGFGDVKLAFFMGLFLGFPDIIVALYSAFTIGAIIGVGLILAKRKNMKSEIPFGPFLIIGTMIAFFWGNQIINWYFNLFS